MTIEGLTQVFDVLGRHYPNFCKASTMDDVKKLFAEWGAILNEYDDAEVLKTVTEYIKTSHFAPNVSDIKTAADKARRVSASDVPDFSRIEAPRIVMDMDVLTLEVYWAALSEYIYDKKEAYQRVKKLRGLVYDFGPIEDKTGGEPWLYLERWPWDEKENKA